MRTKLLHASESLANVVIGYIINLGVVHVYFMSIGKEVTLAENAGLGVACAVVAFIRGYGIRRGYNWLFKRLDNGKEKT